jgi:hypothetical protein
VTRQRALHLKQLALGRVQVDVMAAAQPRVVGYKVTIARLLQFEIKDEQQHCQQLQEFGQKRSAQKAG